MSAEPVALLHPTSCFQCGQPLDSLFRCTACGVISQAQGYRPSRLLAENRHSRVYLAEDVSGRKVALKELVFALVPTVGALDAFEREAKFLQRLSHPRIPRFIESFRIGSGVHTRLYLAQEFLEGETLATRIEKSRLSEGEFVHIARQVLEILIYLHGRTPKMIHRDIKPANLILRPDGSVAVVDFGSARDLTATQTHRSTLVGTFGYMPPEQLGGTIDETSDLYALGASLLHAVSGKPPESMFQRGLAIDAAEERLPLSADHRRFLLRLVAPRPAERFATAQAALEELLSPRRPLRPFSVAAVVLSALTLLGLTAATPFLVKKALFAAISSGSDAARTSQKTEFPKEIEEEALQHLRALYTAEKAYYAERDQYSADLRAIGFEPNGWCPDGARLQISQGAASPNEVIGCHFIYRVELNGTGPQGQFTMYARGAAPPAIGLDFAVASDGEQRGVLQRAMRPH